MFSKERYYWVALRLFMGLLFFWAFIDKTFGLGFATTAEKSWLNGGSPTFGFLKMGAYGPLANFYHSLAGQPVVDWLFMLGLLGIGLALILGVFVKFASWSGTLLVLLMYSALLPPKNHPFLDEHILEAIAFVGLAIYSSTAGARWWRMSGLVQKCKWLE